MMRAVRAVLEECCQWVVGVGESVLKVVLVWWLVGVVWVVWVQGVVGRFVLVYRGPWVDQLAYLYSQ